MQRPHGAPAAANVFRGFLAKLDDDGAEWVVWPTMSTRRRVRTTAGAPSLDITSGCRRLYYGGGHDAVTKMNRSRSARSGTE